MLNNLPEKYQPIDVFIDTEGTWHIDGLPIKPESLLKKADVAFIAMHGEYGEDGKVQKILETHGIPFTGSGSFASAMGMNKAKTKEIFKQYGIKTPYHILLNKAEMTKEKVHELFRSFPHPNIVKPASAGSSIGVSKVEKFDELEPALLKAFEYGPVVIMEEFIAGKEATCGVVNNFRNEELYSLLPVEIRKPAENAFFDYDAKYNGKSEEICPGNFTAEEKHHIQEAAKAIHKALGLRHYSRSDFIVHPRRGIYALEVNTLPGLTSESLLPKSLAAVGSTLPEFFDHIITLALAK